MFATITLAATLILYAIGSATALLELSRRESRLEKPALFFMLAGRMDDEVKKHVAAQS